MGEIIIEVPDTATRRYRLSNKASVRSIIAALDASAIRVKADAKKLTKRQVQDDLDYRSAIKNVAEMKRTGEFYTVDDLRAEFNLS